jgi:hypothetical protein
MSTTPRRRITLFDLMVLTAATAIGLSLVHVALWGYTVSAGLFARPLWHRSYPSKAWMVPIAERVVPFLPCLAAWNGAFLITRLRGPRPRWRRLVFQPGFVAAVVALSILAAESLLLFGSATIDGQFGRSSPQFIALFVANGVVLVTHHAGWAVAVSWCTLAFAGRWRPEPSWVDRWGRALGCTWIILAPMASLLIDHFTWWGAFISR